VVNFKPSLTVKGFDVEVNGVQIGCIDSKGFFTDPVVGAHNFIRVNPIDLRAIADKVEEVVRVRGTPKSK